MKAVRNGCPDVRLSDGLENGERLHPKLGWTLYEPAQSLVQKAPEVAKFFKNDGCSSGPDSNKGQDGCTAL